MRDSNKIKFIFFGLVFHVLLIFKHQEWASIEHESNFLLLLGWLATAGTARQPVQCMHMRSARRSHRARGGGVATQLCSSSNRSTVALCTSGAWTTAGGALDNCTGERRRCTEAVNSRQSNSGGGSP
jgi:hypothetical protein